ncbi:exonuclease domain-containing protein [Pseudactinotalea sp. Z1732]|uniref:exonuclease domain-containing protein n=1 Tax=Micrococcales TaxID=85006 RepID=UPI003C7E7900
MVTWFADSLRRRRARAAQDARGPLARYYREPAPADSTPAGDLAVLALDLECTSLDLDSADILSIGWVPVQERRILLGRGRRVVVNPGREVGPNVTVHGLTDDVVAAGAPLPEAVEQMLHACTGRVLVAHHATIETTLLSRACELLYGAPFVPPVIDTLALQRRILGWNRGDQENTGLNLAAARGRYGLPRYAAHDALTDAIACAELFLAQLSHWGTSGGPTLRTLRLR